MKTRFFSTAVAVLSLACIAAPASHAQGLPEPDEIKSIAQEALVYSLPIVMGYGVMHGFSIDEKSPNFKAPINHLYNEARTFTPADTGVVTPNSDTPYSFAWIDLRAEPMVICIPEIEKDRYYSVMLTSLYTYNFGYLGSRTTGNGGGCYAVAGPEWAGDTPKGVEKVIISGTQFAFAVFRTQLFNPADIDNVRAIQAKYSVEPLSKFLGEPAPAAAPQIDWPKFESLSKVAGEPVTTLLADKDWAKFNEAVAKMDPFSYLAFVLQFAPATGPAAVEAPLRDKFASIGIEAGKPFSTDGWSDKAKAALAEGILTGTVAVTQQVKDFGKDVNGWQISTGLFGSREILGDDYMTRAVAAVAGIYGNDSAEALYPATKVDQNGQPLDGSKANYTITFKADNLPPVNAFWSITIYNDKTQLLVANPIKRYLINSPMLRDMKKNADGSLTLYVQHNEPSNPNQKANWLPAPDDLIYLVMRLYWPKESALNGTWKPPFVEKVAN